MSDLHIPGPQTQAHPRSVAVPYAERVESRSMTLLSFIVILLLMVAGAHAADDSGPAAAAGSKVGARKAPATLHVPVESPSEARARPERLASLPAVAVPSEPTYAIDVVQGDQAPAAATARSAVTAAALIAPRNGETLSNTQLFHWSASQGAQEYWLWVGSCQDCTDIYDAGSGLDRSTVVNLPSDGRILYVTLFTFSGGDWYWYDYRFRAASANGARADLLSPPPASTVALNQTFTWSAGSYARTYWLRIGSCSDCADVLDEDQGLRRARTVAVPSDGRTLFVTLFTLIGNDWLWTQQQYRAPLGGGSGGQQVTISLNNRLIYPVTVLVNGAEVGSVPAGETRQHTTSASSIQVSWRLARPRLDGRELGDEMGGNWSAIDNPSGEYRFTVDNVVGDSHFFAPLITNRSVTGLMLEANGGYEHQTRCDCVIPAGGVNVHSGYYRLFSNSNVRLYRAANGYTGRYIYWGTEPSGEESPSGPLYRMTESESGVVRLAANSAP